MSSFLKKLRFKIGKKWKSLNDNPHVFPITTSHQKAASIFRISLKDNNAKLILMPVTNKRIIKIEKKGLYIKLERYSLSIINHKYSYIVELPYEVYDKLSKMFDDRVDNYYSKEEQQILNQLELGISKVLESIKK
jgi:hypothetical protein